MIISTYCKLLSPFQPIYLSSNSIAVTSSSTESQCLVQRVEGPEMTSESPVSVHSPVGAVGCHHLTRLQSDLDRFGRFAGLLLLALANDPPVVFLGDPSHTVALLDLLACQESIVFSCEVWGEVICVSSLIH